MRLSSSLFSVWLLALAACGGGGNSASTATAVTTPTTVPTTTPTTTPTSARPGNLIFVGDNRNFVMGAVDTLTPKPGTLAAKVFRTGATDWLDAAFDGTRDELYVSAWSSIDVYESASKLDGTISPSRKIIPKIGQIADPNLIGGIQRIVLDKANDRLYVSFTSTGPKGIAVFDQVSKLNGAVAASRVITGPFDTNSFAIDLKRNLLYSCWSHGSPCDVLVFENINTAQGELKVARRSRIFTFVKGFAMDSDRDRLYMGSETGTVLILDGASASTGDARVTTVALPSRYSNSAITFDPANDRLYAGFSEQVFVLDKPSLLNGTNAAAQAVAITVPGNAGTSYFAVPQ